VLHNPPPAVCEHCRHAGTPFVTLEGEGGSVTLVGGRAVTRPGSCYVCRWCGHTVPLSRELAR